jgi:hypothetical protein
MSHDTIDRVMATSGDAFLLLTLLKRHHWGRDFALANAMAAGMGWRLSRWRDARNALVRLGMIACVHEGGMGPSDPPIYGWADGIKL